MVNAPQMRNLWLNMPDTRPVTFRRRTTTSPTYTDYAVSNAWYRPDETQEGEPSQGVYIRRYRRWYLVKDMLKAAGYTGTPDVADAVIDGTTDIDPVSGQWTILGVTEVGALGAWQLRSVLIEVRGAFAVTVAINRRMATQDATARMLPVTTILASVAGWFQPDDAAAEPELLGKTQVPARGVVYLASYVPGIGATDTLMVGSTSYNVTEVRNPLHLEELQSVAVELAR